MLSVVRRRVGFGFILYDQMRLLLAILFLFFQVYSIAQTQGELVFHQHLLDSNRHSGVQSTRDIFIDDSNYVWVFGDFRGSMNFSDLNPNSVLSATGASVDGFVGKFDTLGNFISGFKIGGAGYLTSRKILVNSIGEIFVGGEATSNISFPVYGNEEMRYKFAELYVIKFNQQGEALAHYVLDSVQGTVNFNDFTIDHNNNVYIAGGFVDSIDFDHGPGLAKYHSGGGEAAFIVKLDNAFGFQEVKIFNSPNSLIRSIETNSSGELFFTGQSSISFDIHPHADSINLISGNGLFDFFIGKFDANGQLSFINNFGGSGLDNIYSLALFPNGNFLVSGFISGVVDLDPSALASNSSSPNGRFFAIYSPNGDFNSFHPFTGVIYSIFCNSNNEIILTGNCNGVLDLDPGPSQYNVATSGGSSSEWFYFGKYSSYGAFVSGFSVYQPNSGTLLLRSVTNSLGSKLFLGGIINGSSNLSPSGTIIVNPTNTYQSGFLCAWDLTSQSFLWGKSLDGFSFDASDQFIPVTCKFLESGFYLGGSFNRGFDLDPGPGEFGVVELAGQSSAYIARYTNAGDFVFGGILTSSGSLSLSSLATSINGDLVVGGQFNGNLNVSLTGTANVNLPTTGSFVSTYDSLGQLLNYFTISDFTLQKLVTDDNGNVFITGFVNSTSDLDPGPSNVSGYSGVAVAKYNSNLGYLTSFSISSGINVLSSMQVIDQQLVVLGKFSSNTSDFDPGPGVFAFSGLSQSVFLAKYDLNLSFLAGRSISSSNPLTKFISTGKDSSGSLFVLLDGHGNLNLGPGPGSIPITLNSSGSGIVIEYDWNNLNCLSFNRIPYLIPMSFDVELDGSYTVLERSNFYMSVPGLYNQITLLPFDGQIPSNYLLRFNRNHLLTDYFRILSTVETNPAQILYFDNRSFVLPISISSDLQFNDLPPENFYSDYDIHLIGIKFESHRDVWPGDCNYDGVVNGFDMFNIGLGYGVSGVSRAQISTSWQPFHCESWNNFFSSGENYKHSDTNGDGIINDQDTVAVVLTNLGQTHFLAPYDMTYFRTGGVEFSITSNESSFLPGDTMVFRFDTGLSNDIIDLYGIAGNFTLDTNLFFPGSLNFYWDTTIVGGAPSTIRMAKLRGNHVDFAIVRKDNLGIDTSGRFFTFSCVAKNASLLGQSFTIENLDIRMVNSTGEIIPLSILDSINVFIDGSIGLEEDKIHLVSLFPNPAWESLLLDAGTQIIQKIVISDCSGKVIWIQNSSHSSQKMDLDIRLLQTGIYFIDIYLQGEICRKKFIKLK